MSDEKETVVLHPQQESVTQRPTGRLRWLTDIGSQVLQQEMLEEQYLDGRPHEARTVWVTVPCEIVKRRGDE